MMPAAPCHVVSSGFSSLTATPLLRSKKAAMPLTTEGGELAGTFIDIMLRMKVAKGGTPPLPHRVRNRSPVKATPCAPPARFALWHSAQ